MEPFGDTTVLRRRLGPLYKFWVWFAAQWSLTSIITVATILVGGGAYLLTLRTRVVVLETQIVPDLQLAQRVSKLEGEVGGIREDYRWAREHAGDRPQTGPGRQRDPPAREHPSGR